MEQEASRSMSAISLSSLVSSEKIKRLLRLPMQPSVLEVLEIGPPWSSSWLLLASVILSHVILFSFSLLQDVMASISRIVFRHWKSVKEQTFLCDQTVG